LLGASILVAQLRSYVGVPVFNAAGPNLYANIEGPQGIGDVATEVEAQMLSNFGGIMFWNGPWREVE
jgi:hypothetical protein